MWFWLRFGFAYSVFAAYTQIFISDPRKITRQEKILTSVASVYKYVCVYLSRHLSIPYVMHTEYFKKHYEKETWNPWKIIVYKSTSTSCFLCCCPGCIIYHLVLHAPFSWYSFLCCQILPCPFKSKVVWNYLSNNKSAVWIKSLWRAARFPRHMHNRNSVSLHLSTGTPSCIS